MRPKNYRRGPQKSRDPIAEQVLRLPRVQEQTGAETLYLTHLIQNKAPVIVRLINGEEISGWIEYYDKNFIRVTRENAANVFVYKDQIRFIVEAGQR
jgi:RNA chaperone Hfq